MLNIDWEAYYRANRISALKTTLDHLQGDGEALSNTNFRALVGDVDFQRYLAELEDFKKTVANTRLKVEDLPGNADAYHRTLRKIIGAYPAYRITEKGLQVQQKTVKGLKLLKAKPLTIKQQTARMKCLQEAEDLADFFENQLTDYERSFFREPDILDRNHDSVYRLETRLFVMKNGLENHPHMQNPPLYVQRTLLVDILERENPQPEDQGRPQYVQPEVIKFHERIERLRAKAKNE